MSVDRTLESPFPESPRLHFKRNPIQTAMTQFSFPTVLRIGSEPPAAYQGAIRENYPLFRMREATRLPDQLQFIQPVLPPEFQVRLYDFGSPDGMWTVTLAQDFLTLQTNQYTRWEDFRSRLEGVLQPLMEHYQPSFFARIGLRYQDVFVRSALGLEKASWSQLFEPALAGELTDDQVSANIVEKLSRLVIRLNDKDGHVTINHGLETTEDEQRYFIDADFYKSDQILPGEALDVLGRLKRHAGRFFRWCITPVLVEAMQPEPLEDV
jgi:uncharacterized protein (TIGR04255 family)